MLRLAFNFFIITYTFVLFFATPLYAAPRIGQNAPSFKVITTAGLPLTLESYGGQVLIIDFFAVWCQPCRLSIPHLLEMQSKFGRQGLQILGINADEQGEKLLNGFIDKQKIVYPIALASDNLLSDYSVRAVPVMYIVDKKGKIAEIFRGYNSEIGRKSEALIKKLLAER